LKKLVIISHTPHYRSSDNSIVGWGPTINELNYLSAYFDKIVHIAPLHPEPAPSSSSAYSSPKIEFVAIPPSGGDSILSKLTVLSKIPIITRTVSEQLRDASYVQLRVPTGIAVFLLPYFSWFIKRSFVFWVKYAGNWDEQNAPLGYRFQRWFLRENFAQCAVTINGKWPGQKPHMNSIENPCLNEADIEKGGKLQKDFNIETYNVCFVGGLTDDKGVPHIIKMLNNKKIREKINIFFFVGDGPKRDGYIKQIDNMDNIQFLGFKDKQGVHDILIRSHFIVLPSKSEGFPKVIAEAACYGCIPIVSDVSCIGQYINETNGYLWNQEQPFYQLASTALNENKVILHQKSNGLKVIAPLFTFTHFKNSLFKILNIGDTTSVNNL
jgi:glycosyltransferase involved in cell wall biosynthesis